MEVTFFLNVSQLSLVMK